MEQHSHDLPTSTTPTSSPCSQLPSSYQYHHSSTTGSSGGDGGGASSSAYSSPSLLRLKLKRLQAPVAPSPGSRSSPSSTPPSSSSPTSSSGSSPPSSYWSQPVVGLFSPSSSSSSHSGPPPPPPGSSLDPRRFLPRHTHPPPPPATNQSSPAPPFCRLPRNRQPLLLCPNPSPPPHSVSPPPPHRRRCDRSVWLHVYDLEAGVSKMLNHLVRDLGTGAYHAGVEIFRSEYYFGQTSDGSTGICMTSPRKHPVHAYRESIHMGRTNMSEDEFNSLMVDVRRRWPGISYDLLSRNCLNFADHFCQALGVGRIPEWIMSMQLSATTAANHIAAAATALQDADQALGVSSSLKAFGSFLLQQNEERGISTRIQQAVATGWNLIHSPYDGLSTTEESESDNEGTQYERVDALGASSVQLASPSYVGAVGSQLCRIRQTNTGEGFVDYEAIIGHQQHGGNNTSSGGTCRQALSRGGYESPLAAGGGGGNDARHLDDVRKQPRKSSTESIEGISTGSSSDVDPSTSAEAYNCTYRI
eukprot:GHVS01063737.1.p1 GENE.GHVS01063737.1~~GHVS01063737.1.p1  ORF type:complete len:530 (+),score=123.27 GHVS01063737.1:220-1809(+)